MSYVKPSDLALRMIDAGAQKSFMSTRDTLIRAYMGGAILGLAAAFAITITAQTGSALVGAMLFPVGFVLLYLMGFDLLTGVFTLVPLALLDKRRGVTVKSMFRNWGLVFLGNFFGAFTVAVLMAIYFTTGFATPPDEVGVALMEIGHGRTVGYAEYGAAGMLTLFVRAILCNWMVSTGVVAAMMSDSVPGKVIGMWLPIMLFFYMGFEHSIVNMFLFPVALLMGGDFTVIDYLIWNEIPTVLGNLLGGLMFVGLTIYITHRRTGPSRELQVEAEKVPAGA
ncbi:formate/nitrite transporter family protein [Nesterenkonia salmonea]|uniref:Formate/nitrite transporter family protein n=1 Tax=Nesterenkonia salmonea TaxID=1804987 RepID=A0A5R9B8S5_9MICC|nr:formate/nitrite transporter family protein [Nesterenkonia salmonea]TLP94586.1 formate/nitrite transporter family protein [Nesterenkonia salmonea]